MEKVVEIALSFCQNQYY